MILRQHGAVKQRITFTAPINNDDIENVRNIGRDVDRTESRDQRSTMRNLTLTTSMTQI